MTALSDFAEVELAWREHAESMMRYFAFPGRARSRQYAEALEVVPWVIETVGASEKWDDQTKHEEL